MTRTYRAEIQGLKLTLTYHPGIPSWGLDPPEGPEVEVDGVTDVDHAALMRLTEEQFEQLYDAALAEAERQYREETRTCPQP